MRKQHFKDEEGNELLSHYCIVERTNGEEVSIPVVDVRDGISYRMLAMQMVKANGKSRWINYNSYHVSKKA